MIKDCPKGNHHIWAGGYDKCANCGMTWKEAGYKKPPRTTKLWEKPHRLVLDKNRDIWRLGK